MPGSVPVQVGHWGSCVCVWREGCGGQVHLGSLIVCHTSSVHCKSHQLCNSVTTVAS